MSKFEHGVEKLEIANTNGVLSHDQCREYAKAMGYVSFLSVFLPCTFRIVYFEPILETKFILFEDSYLNQ